MSVCVRWWVWMFEWGGNTEINEQHVVSLDCRFCSLTAPIVVSLPPSYHSHSLAYLFLLHPLSTICFL